MLRTAKTWKGPFIEFVWPGMKTRVGLLSGHPGLRKHGPFVSVIVAWWIRALAWGEGGLHKTSFLLWKISLFVPKHLKISYFLSVKLVWDPWQGGGAIFAWSTKMKLFTNKSGLFTCPAILPYGHNVILSLCHSVCLAHCISSCLSDWLFDILWTLWTTFVLITKLKSLSVFLSVCLTVGLSFYLSDILLTFWTTFVLITKLKSWKIFLHPYSILGHEDL